MEVFLSRLSRRRLYFSRSDVVNVLREFRTELLRPSIASIGAGFVLALMFLLILGSFGSSASADLKLAPYVKFPTSCCHLPQVFDEGDNPVVSAVIYNSVPEDKIIVEEVYKEIDRDSIKEVIICADEGSAAVSERWANRFTSRRHFTLHTNHLGRESCFNRAMRSSSAEFFLLLNDTDSTSLQSDEAWLRHALSLFKHHPSLGILGGAVGYIWEDKVPYEFSEVETLASSQSSKPTTRLIPFVSEESSLPFMYVECLSGAPLLVRSKMLEEMPGFRLDIPQSMSDYALALDAWSAGWQVGVFGASTVDTRPFGLNDVHKTVRRLEKLLRYDRKSILNRIRDLNIRTLTQRFKE